jgi:membrane protein DedA with SNARE-associated domain
VDTITAVLGALMTLPPIVLYLLLGGGAAVENIAPPVPADTFVLAGAILAAEGAADPWLVFTVTWSFNVASAVAVYVVAWRYGTGFFKMPIARWLLREHQLEEIGSFYRKWGLPAIFFSRFLPAWRAMVPVFAGVSRASPWKVVPPMLVASALWYGILVYLGVIMARSLETLVERLGSINSVLLWIAVVVGAVVGVWWWRTRHHRDDS